MAAVSRNYGGYIMRDYVIIADSSCDLPKETIKNWGIECIEMKYRFDDENTDRGNYELTAKEFYDKIINRSLCIKNQKRLQQPLFCVFYMFFVLICFTLVFFVVTVMCIFMKIRTHVYTTVFVCSSAFSEMIIVTR